VIIPDMNLLIYAYTEGAPHHKAARLWWERLLNGQEPVGIPWSVMYAFVRLMTSARVLESPIGMSEALGIVDSWLKRPQVMPLSPGTRHVELFFGFLRSSGGSSNLTVTAAIAAIATEHKATIHSCDKDFLRFPGLSVVNPLKQQALAADQ